MEERIQHRTPAPVRLRFVLGERSTDLALPSEVALVDVLPAVLPVLDPHAPDHGAEHDGWVVQRLGEPPLDEERSATELNLRDGETVYVRPRSSALPTINFDDLVDGVAEQVRDGAGYWSVDRSRYMLLAGAALTLPIGLATLALGGPVGARALVAALLAMVLVVAAGLASRAAADPLAGAVLAGTAALYAAGAGWYAGSWAAPAASWPVLAGCAVLSALAVLCVGLAAVADAALLFAGTMTFALVSCLPVLIAGAGALDNQDSAATGLAVSLVVGMFLPLIAFRLGGLSLPMLPGNAEELGEDTEPVPEALVIERGAATIGYLSALAIGLACAQIVLGIALLLTGGVWTMVLVATVAASLFLRARYMSTAVQRWAVLTSAGALVAGDVLRWTADHDFGTRIAVVVPLLMMAGVGLIVGSRTLPGRRLRPYWGRAMDILESLVAIAVLPILGAVLDLYPAIRAWTGG